MSRMVRTEQKTQGFARRRSEMILVTWPRGILTLIKE